jgi:hypothetical protein
MEPKRSVPERRNSPLLQQVRAGEVTRMHTRTWTRLLLGWTLGTLAMSAQAQDNREDVPPEPEAAEPAQLEEPEAVFRAFGAFAEEQRIARITGAVGGVVLGAVTMGVGTYAANETDTTAAPWLIAGGLSAGLGLLALVVPGESERVAHDASVSGGEAHTSQQARALELRWRQLAAAAKTERHVGAAIGFVLGAGGLGSGIAVLSGVGDLDADQQPVIGSLLIGVGAAVLVASAASLFVLTPTERAFAQYSQTRSGGASLELSAGVGPGAFALAARGAF